MMKDAQWRGCLQRQGGQERESPKSKIREGSPYESSKRARTHERTHFPNIGPDGTLLGTVKPLKERRTSLSLPALSLVAMPLFF